LTIQQQAASCSGMPTSRTHCGGGNNGSSGTKKLQGVEHYGRNSNTNHQAHQFASCHHHMPRSCGAWLHHAAIFTVIFMALVPGATTFLQFPHHTTGRRECLRSSSQICMSYDMQWIRLTSIANDAVKRATKLREQVRFRKDQGTALVVGAAPVSELCRTGGAAEVGHPRQ
jgi:hypothetical protein